MSDFNAVFRFACYPAGAFRVVSGAFEGDPVGGTDDVMAGDIYRLARGATPARLAIGETGAGAMVVAPGSQIGAAGSEVRIAACHLWMGPRGETAEALLVEIAGEATPYLLPLGTIRAEVDYELIGAEAEGAAMRLADVVSVSFLAGTNLTLADGRQCPVEDLRVGDRLRTRDHGAQPVRWIGLRTRRATGAGAPIRIAQGTLNTARDLRLLPQHRLFIWQRRDAVGAGRAEVMVKAEQLVNGGTVQREEGGHVDSYQLVFDTHEIIFAEGIAVESLLVTGDGRSLLPPDLSLDATLAAQRDRARFELGDDALPDAADRLSRASRGQGAD